MFFNIFDYLVQQGLSEDSSDDKDSPRDEANKNKHDELGKFDFMKHLCESMMT